MNIAEFLLSRLDEDEDAARLAASRNNGADWETHTRSGKVLSRWGAGMVGVMATCEPGGGAWVVVHIARHDPARVLVEVESKRRLVEMAVTSMPPSPMNSAASAAVLRALALPYADHPDFREEWRA